MDIVLFLIFLFVLYWLATFNSKQRKLIKQRELKKQKEIEEELEKERTKANLKKLYPNGYGESNVYFGSEALYPKKEK